MLWRPFEGAWIGTIHNLNKSAACTANPLIALCIDRWHRERWLVAGRCVCASDLMMTFTRKKTHSSLLLALTGHLLLHVLPTLSWEEEPWGRQLYDHNTSSMKYTWIISLNLLGIICIFFRGNHATVLKSWCYSHLIKLLLMSLVGDACFTL